MVFDEIVSEVCDRLNFTSDEARTRVSRNVNARYRRVTSGIGMASSRRVQVSKYVTIGSSQVTFSGIEKVTEVIDKTSGKDVPLKEVTLDEVHLLSSRTMPRNYAVYTMSSTSVTIQIDCTPTTAFLLYADGSCATNTLAGSQSPNFAESFHDILVFGALADEYRKLEKVVLARDAEADFIQRLSDLKMFIAKSAYLDIYQGKDSTKGKWWET